jgi:hypothetical protein
VGNTPGFGDIAIATQDQAATFFASDGMIITQPEPKQLFELPARTPLPEDLGFIP